MIFHVEKAFNALSFKMCGRYTKKYKMRKHMAKSISFYFGLNCKFCHLNLKEAIRKKKNCFCLDIDKFALTHNTNTMCGNLSKLQLKANL